MLHNGTKVLEPVITFCSWSPFPALWPSSTHINENGQIQIRLWGSWHLSRVLSADPQAYSVKSNSDSVPTIQIDLASPQSPDSVCAVDEFARASKQQDEDQGLMMKPPAGPRGPNKSGDTDAPRDQQKLTRCLSDPGPSADEEEDEPFLPWSSRLSWGHTLLISTPVRRSRWHHYYYYAINSNLVPSISQSC